MFFGFLADREGFTTSRKSQRAVSPENEILELCANPLLFHRISAALRQRALTMREAGVPMPYSPRCLTPEKGSPHHDRHFSRACSLSIPALE